MSNLRIFLLGMKEFRSNCTTHFGRPEIEVYDAGRDFAHRITGRIFDPEVS